MKKKIKKKGKFRSLAFTLAIIFSILIIIVLLIASGMQMYFSFSAQQKMLFVNQQLIARNAANTVEHYILNKISILKAIAGRSRLTILPEEHQKLALEKLLGLEPIFRQLVLFNANQEILRVSRISKLLALESMEYNSGELFHKVYQNSTYISPIYIDRITGEPMLIIAVPVTNAFGDIEGILLAESNLKFMWELVEKIKVGNTGHAYVIDEKGYLIAYYDVGRVLKREKLDYLKEVSAFINRSKDKYEGEANISKGIEKSYVLTTYVSLHQPNWAVVVELPILEAYDTVIKTLILSGLVILLSIALAVLSGVYISRRVTKPIIEFRNASAKIGKGEFSSKIDIETNNEIGELATSFNKMVENLKSTTVSRDALVKEVADRKNVEKSLRESEQKMKAILMASPIGICLINKGKLEWANDTFYHMMGYEENLLLGKSVEILCLDIKEFERIRQRLNVGNFGMRIGHAETKLIRKDGSIFDCILGSCSLDPAFPSKGQIVTVNDMSEFKRLQAKLMHAQRMEAIGILAAGVAHDLNNILISLVSYPELLLMNMKEDDILRKPLETIQRSGEKAATIVQDLLTLARRGVAVSESVSLNNVITDYLKSPEYINLYSFHRNIRVNTDLEENLPHILGSPFHLLKVIMNLVANAAESIKDEGRIFISTKNQYVDKPLSGYENIEEGEYVILTVSDDGEGISKEDLKKIFEPFYTKKKMGRSGTGLGMAVIWGTVKDHNGYLDLKSEEGKGTEFSIYFPVDRRKIEIKKSYVNTDTYLAKGETILIVDDVEEQRLIASQMLEKLGYKVASLSSGEEAVDYMGENTVDLILLDMIMDPGIDGLETYKKILKLHPNQKAIIASGFSESERVKEAQRLGAGSYIKKPYSLEKIGRAIRDELDK
jgi:PAS domain S-box-containing protein